MTMKREINSSQKEGDHLNTTNQIQKPEPSITDLPNHIIFDILLKVSAKVVLICKWVCKDWNCIISDPQFAKLHSHKAEPCALIRTFDSTHVSLFDPHTKLSIPLPNAQNECIPQGPFGDQNLQIVNSCNGLLCLSKPNCNGLVIVCNPTTCEYIILPDPVSSKVGEEPRLVVYAGFGFCRGTGQYNVIRMSIVHFACMGWIHIVKGIEMYTLGAASWRCISNARLIFPMLKFTTYLEGSLHWLIGVAFRNGPDFIASFNFDDEWFQMFPSPPCEYFLPDGHSLPGVKLNVSLGVLEGCICLCDASNYDSTAIWHMEIYGVRESWRKLFSIDNQPVQRWPFGLCQPIDYLKNGAILMCHLQLGLITFDPERREWKCFKIHGVESRFEAIAYAPSSFPSRKPLVEIMWLI